MVVDNSSLDYTTGWMVGDIKLATLSDTDSTNLAASELVDNGDFATTSDWGLQSGVSIGNGVLSSDGTTTGELARQSNIGITSGKVYAISFDVISLTAGKFGVKLGGTTPVYFNTTGSHEALFVATATDNVQVMGLSGTTGSVDNVSVKLAEPDRSFNSNGLIIHNTIPRAPVATGAELSGYFTSATTSYLIQPYNSDLDFLQDRTNDYCVMFWGKLEGTGWSPFISISNYGNSKLCWWGAQGQKPAIGSTYIVDYVVDTDRTHHWCYVNRGGTVYFYLDGELLGSRALTATDEAQPNQTLMIGGRHGNDGTGSMDNGRFRNTALARISATAPTAEQIAKIYNDEKHLFVENAQCLYVGNSGVKALANDPDTGLLHVGTTSGRSTFQGLRRVDDTTDGVGVAISASNGLLVEE
jgi:hypothetical protein